MGDMSSEAGPIHVVIAPPQIAAIIKILEEETKSKSDAPTSIAAFQDLATLVFNNETNKQSAGSAGAIRVISETMGAHIDNAALQEAGIKALRNIIFKNGANRARAVGDGALDAISRSLQSFPDAESLQAEGIWTLNVLTANHDSNAKAAGVVIPMIEEALRKFPQSSNIQSRGAFLLAILKE